MLILILIIFASWLRRHRTRTQNWYQQSGHRFADRHGLLGGVHHALACLTAGRGRSRLGLKLRPAKRWETISRCTFAVDAQHLHQTGEIASILFFLMGAMTIVELIDAHEGFSLVTDRIQFRSKRKLLWCIGVLTFFLIGSARQPDFDHRHGLAAEEISPQP